MKQSMIETRCSRLFQYSFLYIFSHDIFLSCAKDGKSMKQEMGKNQKYSKLEQDGKSDSSSALQKEFSYYENHVRLCVMIKGCFSSPRELIAMQKL